MGVDSKPSSNAALVTYYGMYLPVCQPSSNGLRIVRHASAVYRYASLSPELPSRKTTMWYMYSPKLRLVNKKDESWSGSTKDNTDEPTSIHLHPFSVMNMQARSWCLKMNEWLFYLLSYPYQPSRNANQYDRHYWRRKQRGRWSRN